MIVTLNRKVRDRVPAPVPEMPKKCSPPRPGTGGRRGRKPNTAAVPASQLSDVAPARFSLPPQTPLLPFRVWSGVASGRPPSPSGRAGKLVADVLQ